MAHDHETGVLEVEFHDGRIYQYYLVPAKIFDEINEAASIGRYLIDHVIGKFPYTEIDDDDARR